VPAHPVGLELEQRRPVAAAAAVDGAPHRAYDRQKVVAVDDVARHAVAEAAVGQVQAGVLLVRGRREAPLVVLDHEDDRQLPDGRQVERLVEVALARRAVARERRGHALLAAQLRRERQAARDRQHRAEVADHPDDAVLERAEVERAVAAAREAVRPAQQLAEEARQRKPAAREDAEVPVHRQHVVASIERCHDTRGDRLLPDAREPLAEPPLAQQHVHLLLDHPRQQQAAVELAQLIRREARGEALVRLRRLEAAGPSIRDHSRQRAAARQMAWYTARSRRR
jgi:hypothetical protein